MIKVLHVQNILILDKKYVSIIVIVTNHILVNPLTKSLGVKIVHEELTRISLTKLFVFKINRSFIFLIEFEGDKLDWLPKEVLAHRTINNVIQLCHKL